MMGGCPKPLCVSCLTVVIFLALFTESTDADVSADQSSGQPLRSPSHNKPLPYNRNAAKSTNCSESMIFVAEAGECFMKARHHESCIYTEQCTALYAICVATGASSGRKTCQCSNSYVISQSCTRCIRPPSCQMDKPLIPGAKPSPQSACKSKPFQECNPVTKQCECADGYSWTDMRNCERNSWSVQHCSLLVGENGEVNTQVKSSTVTVNLPESIETDSNFNDSDIVLVSTNHAWAASEEVTSEMSPNASSYDHNSTGQPPLSAVLEKGGLGNRTASNRTNPPWWNSEYVLVPISLILIVIFIVVLGFCIDKDVRVKQNETSENSELQIPLNEMSRQQIPAGALPPSVQKTWV